MEHSQSGKVKRKTGMQRIQLVEIALIVLGLLFFGNYASSIYMANQKKAEGKSSGSIVPASVTNTQATKTPVPSVSKVIQAKKVAQPTASPVSDYVRCNISAKCGGGYKEMLKSTCDEMVCCTYSLDYPPVFTSRSDCEVRAKHYDTPILKPDWEYQYGSVYPSPDSSRAGKTAEELQKLIDDCKANAKRTMQDTQSSCPIVGGVQLESCLAQAMTTYTQVSQQCEGIR